MSYLDFLNEHHIPRGFPSSIIAANEDIFNGSPASDVINMSEWRGLLVICAKNTGAVGTAAFTALSCDDTTPNTTTAIAFRERHCTASDTYSAWADTASTGKVITAGADEVWEFFIDSRDLSGTDKYIQAKFTEDDSTAVDGHIITMLIGPRYGKDVPDSVLT
ncbi:MAG: hypothetical protein KAV42_01150 [Candidatus Krumholzibacteria bacterium]|nr:hypothetical protein [Candidatus Krumholzibacteria bacterium]